MKIRCWTFRASLVDFAEGRLDEKERESIEHHLAGCADCAAAVLSLREVPAELRRRASADPGEEFWTRQRERIRGAIDDARVARRRRPEVFLGARSWVPITAVAASALAIVFAVEWRARSSAPPPYSNPNPSRPAVNGGSIHAEVSEPSSAAMLSEELFGAGEVSFETSSTDEPADLGDFFEEATI